MNRKVFRKHERPDRDRQFEVLAGRARSLSPLSMPAAVGAMLGVEAILHKRVHVWARDEIDRSARAAIAAIRAAAWDELLPPEAHRAAATVAGRHFDFYFINEHKQ